MYLLDTDTIIYALKGHPVVTGNLTLNKDEPMKLSIVTLMELYHGAYKSQQVAGNLAKIRTLENAMDIVPLDKEAAEIFGLQKSLLEKLGTPLDDFDLSIAACALNHNLTLVTNNTKHFQRIEGLKLENWAA